MGFRIEDFLGLRFRISNRNVPKIKSVMLSRDTHLQICGGETKISAAMGAFEVIFSDVASVGLLQATSVCRAITD